MPDSDRSTLDGYFDVVCKMISGLSSVINLFVIYMRVFGQYSINNLVIWLEITVEILLLDKIKSNSLIPIKFAYFTENGFVLFVIKNFQSKEDETNREPRKLFFDFSQYFINSVHKHFFVMLFDQFTSFVVFIKFTKHGSELYSIVTIFGIFDKYMLEIFSENV